MKKEEYLSKLYEAYAAMKPLSKDIFPDHTELEEAYEIQHAFTALKEQHGEKLAGYKISMTSAGTQALFNAKEPLYGQITDKRIRTSLSLEQDTLDALLELELMFIAQEDLSADDFYEDILKKVKVAPGLEIPDSRYESWFPEMSKEHVCCDGAVGGYVCIGKALPATYENLDHIHGALFFNGQQVSENTSDIVLGHPVKAVKWLLEKLAQHKLTLKKGMFISSGTFVYPEKLQKGVYEGKFENFGSVTFTVE